MDWHLPMGCLLVSYFLSVCSLHHVCITCTKYKFWFESFVCELISIVPLKFLSGYRMWPLHIPYGQCSESTAMVTPIDSWVPLLSKVSVWSRRCHSPLHPAQLKISIHFHDHQVISSVVTHTWSWTPHSPSIPLPSQFPPSNCLLFLFYSSF